MAKTLTAPTPQFNASIQYLISVTSLIDQILLSSMQKDTETMFYACEGLHGQLYPRMETDDREKMKELLLKMRNNRVSLQSNNALDSTGWHYQLNDWFNQLNVIAHDLKLLMNDKLSMEDKFDQL